MSKTDYYIKSYRRRRSKKRRFFKVSSVLIAFFLIIFVTNKLVNKKPELKVSPPASVPVITTKEDSVRLGEAVDAALSGSLGEYGIVVYKFDPEEIYTKNEKESFDSASLYKLWVMATVFNEMKGGKITGNDVLSKDAKDLNKEFGIASESADISEGTVSMSVSEALEKMITISDNTAALLLSDRVGLSSVADFLSDNGFVNSKLGDGISNPRVTAYDAALFFDKLYQGKLVDKNYSDQMLDLLKRQRLNEKIPKYLPDGTIVAHKTGELDEFSHDSGIVYSPSGDYIIVILSSSNDRDLADERLANISKNVYDYFAAESSSK